MYVFVENNEYCVILQVKEDKRLDLIRLGYFEGNEKLIRVTKGRENVCTIYKDDNDSFSWGWQTSLVVDEVAKMRKLIESCIVDDFDIYIGKNEKLIKKSLNIKSLNDSKNSKHFIEIMYFNNDGNVVVHKDNEFYKTFPNSNSVIEYFKNLDYDVNYRNKYIAYTTGCIVEEYGIQRNIELSDRKEGPYYFQNVDINELSDDDTFAVAGVTDGVNCVELYYNQGKAAIEYGTRFKSDEWESEFQEIDWFNKDMSEEEISNKLWSLFAEHYELKPSESEITI